jgi:hypothetical protein
MGIAEPVVLVLTGGSTHARSIKQKLKDSSLSVMDLLPNADDGGSMVLLAASDAAQLLREHAGQGGVYVGEMIESKKMIYDYLIVTMLDDLLGLAAVFNGVEISRGATRYDEVDRDWMHEMRSDKGAR